jgi:hypothetical protein
MPKSFWKYTVALIVLSLVTWSSAARAQDAETVNPHPNPNKAHPVLHFLHIPTPCCWASHNGYSCSSFQSENIFLFGSCRAFFGEPCLNGPPPPPWDPESGPPPPKAGCNCRLP